MHKPMNEKKNATPATIIETIPKVLPTVAILPINPLIFYIVPRIIPATPNATKKRA